MAKVCLILGQKSLTENSELLKQYEGDYDLVEVRADYLDPEAWDYLNRWGENLPCPAILTLRLPEDGGVFKGGAPSRRAFFEKAVHGPWSYLDIEAAYPLPSHEKAFIDQGGTIVRSFHDFHGIPQDWVERLKAASGTGYLPKVAVTPKTTKELNEFLIKALDLAEVPKVLLAMGTLGTPTRILAEKLGSTWTYGSATHKILAPGLLDAPTLNHLYSVRDLKKTTKIYGILGNPVVQTKSPRIHNPAFSELDLDSVYLPFQGDNFLDFLETAEILNIQGLSITIPFKEEAARWLGTKASTRVQTIGACNTLYKDKKGVWQGENTDAPGFLAPLLRTLGNRSLKGLPVTVLGTGGAARGVVYALTQAGAEVLVLGRRENKVQELVRDFNVAGGPLLAESLADLRAHSQVIVQTTSVGMGDQEGFNPIEWYTWKGHEIAYDVIYNPEKTTFLAAAEKHGCYTIGGLPMLWEQAYRQFELFTGQKYPESLKLKY